MRKILLLWLAVGLTNAVVEFTNSALYDIYDFRGTEEVHITKCDNGCFIFAATQGEGFVQYPEGLDPYAMNLIITDNVLGNTFSIAKLAQQRDEKQRKKPLTINGRGSMSVVNKNDPADPYFSTILLYVIEKTTATEFSTYEVYDVYYTSKTTITPQSDIVTFLSAYAFRIISPANNQANSVTVRPVGFDNALDNNKDGCPYAFKTPDATTFPGFTILSNPQILSLVISKRNPIQLSIDLQFNSLEDLAVAGFIASPGWNGCTKPTNGGIQSFRTREDQSTDTYILSNSNGDFKVSVDVLPNFDTNHKLVIEDYQQFDSPTVVTGSVQQHYDFPQTHYLLIDFQKMNGDQGFFLRYSSTPIAKTTTPNTEPSKISSTVTTPSLTSPTTSSGYKAVGCISMLLLAFPVNQQ